MKLFFEELAIIEKTHADFFEKNKIGIDPYIRTYKSPAMVEFSKTMLRNYPLPEVIKAEIETLISNPRVLRSINYTKRKKTS